jgi:serine/threonine-protein kinase
MLELSQEDAARLEQAVQAFESAWLSGRRPAIDDYLTVGDPCRLSFLIELVHADLEFRLKAGDVTRVETYLERYPELAGDPELAADLIWAEYQLRSRTGPPGSFDEYQQRFPQYAAALAYRLIGPRPTDSTIEESPRTPGPTPPHTPAGSWEHLLRSAAAPAAAPGRYRPLQFHARGGLGEVLRALDEELHREVALKRIQPGFARDADSRHRFLREAEITARLEHPGIVPVYGLVQDEAGQPSYAMRFIEGESLQDAIRRFHQADAQAGWDAAERNLTLRELLGRFSAVCKTIAFAHSRGIIHRDLKPANIMLGAYGETLVVDWGLAKGMTDCGLQIADLPNPIQPCPSANPQSAIRNLQSTQPGQLLGTPAYMSPEQAAGRWDVVGRPADIYGLGATLYHLLTGQAPFVGGSQGEVLDRVQKGLCPRPRQLARDVPAGLEAVCLKAMALRPEDRYATGLDLATDVEHWLADEPVAAYREPWTVRARRWVGRHRALVMSAAAGLLVGAVSLTVLAAMLSAKNQDLQAANDQATQAKLEADRQRDQARSDFRLARQTVNQFGLVVSNNLRLRAEDLRDLRTQLLRQAVHFHERFKEHHGDDPEVQRDRAQAYFQLGTLTRQIARPEDALRFYRQALVLYQELAHTSGSAVDHGEEARCLRMLGGLYHDLGQNRAAELVYRKALAIQDPLTAAPNARPVYQVDRAQTYGLLGILYRDTGKFESAEAAYGKARDIMQELVDAYPMVADYQADLALHLDNLGVLYKDSHRSRQAGQTYRKALAVWQRLAAAHPQVVDYQAGLAQSHNNLGAWFRSRGRLDSAQKALQNALVLRRQLADRHPSVTEYQAELADTLTNLGVVYSETNQFLPAEQSLQQSLSLRRRLTELYPRVTNFHLQLAGILNNLGAMYADKQRWADAEAAYHQARAIQHRLVQTHPDVPEYLRDLGCGFHNMGVLARSQRKHALALAWFNHALRTLEGLRPDQRDTTADHFLGFARAGQSRMLTLSWLENPAEVARAWDRVLSQCPEPDRVFCRIQGALNLARAGGHAQAAAEADLLSKDQTISPGNLYDLACVHAQAAAALTRDSRVPAAERKARAEKQASRAVALLHQARSAGYFQTAGRVQSMDRDRDLRSLRSRTDFKEFVKDLKR